MWAPVALFLMVVATAVGTLGGEAAPEAATFKAEDLRPESAGMRISLEPQLQASAVPASLNRSVLHAAEAAASNASRQVKAAMAPLAVRESLASEDSVFRSAELALIESNSDSDLIEVLLDEQSLDGVTGSPQMFSTSLHRALTESGDIGVEAGLQLPLFDDRPGMPTPELVFGIRVRF